MPSGLTDRLVISCIDEWENSGDGEGMCHLRRHVHSVKERQPKQASA